MASIVFIPRLHDHENDSQANFCTALESFRHGLFGERAWSDDSSTIITYEQNEKFYYSLFGERAWSQDSIIFVRVPTADKTFTLGVEPSMTIADVKNLLSLKDGFSYTGWRIIFAGKDLEDFSTLMDYNITPDNTITCVPRLLGGARTKTFTDADEAAKVIVQVLDLYPDFENSEELVLFTQAKQEEATIEAGLDMDPNNMQLQENMRLAVEKSHFLLCSAASMANQRLQALQAQHQKAFKNRQLATEVRALCLQAGEPFTYVSTNEPDVDAEKLGLLKTIASTRISNAKAKEKKKKAATHMKRAGGDLLLKRLMEKPNQNSQLLRPDHDLSGILVPHTVRHHQQFVVMDHPSGSSTAPLSPGSGLARALGSFKGLGSGMEIDESNSVTDHGALLEDSESQQGGSEPAEDSESQQGGSEPAEDSESQRGGSEPAEEISLHPPSKQGKKKTRKGTKKDKHQE